MNAAADPGPGRSFQPQVVSALPLMMLAFAAVEAIAGEQAPEAFADQASDAGPEGTGAFLEPLLGSGGSLTVATVVFT